MALLRDGRPRSREMMVLILNRIKIYNDYGVYNPSAGVAGSMSPLPMSLSLSVEPS